MSWVVLLVVLVLVAIGVARPTVRREVVGSNRFQLAVVFAVIGILIGGLRPSSTLLGWGLLVLGLALGLAVGWGRAVLTRVRLADDGRVYSQHTPLGNTLYLVLVVTEAGVSWFGSLHGASRGVGAFGQVLLVIAMLTAVEAELVWRRARRLGDLAAKKDSR